MTVSELIALLEQYDGALPVCTAWPHGVREIEEPMLKLGDGHYWADGGSCSSTEGEFLFIDWGVRTPHE
jgi:hypothetical protein